MCSRKDDGKLAISVISTRTSVNAGSTLTIPQRAGRVRILFTMPSSSFLEVWAPDVTSGQAIGYTFGGGPPLVFDINHYGRIITGQLTLRNGSGGSISVDIVEHVESLI